MSTGAAPTAGLQPPGAERRTQHRKIINTHLSALSPHADRTARHACRVVCGSVFWAAPTRGPRPVLFCDNGSDRNFRPCKGAGFTQKLRCSIHRGARHKVYECIVTLQLSTYNR